MAHYFFGLTDQSPFLSCPVPKYHLSMILVTTGTRYLLQYYLIILPRRLTIERRKEAGQF